MFPFIFLNNGKAKDKYSFQGEKECLIWFKNEVPEEMRKKIEKLCPKPLHQTMQWGRKQLYNYSITDEDEIFGYYLKKLKLQQSSEEYELLIEKALDEFAAEIEQWALKVHEIAPLSFFIGVDRITGSEWDTWSKEKFTDIQQELETFSQSNFSPTEKMILEKAIEMLKSLFGEKFQFKMPSPPNTNVGKQVIEVDKDSIEKIITAQPIALIAFLSNWDEGSKIMQVSLDEVMVKTEGKFSIGKVFVEKSADLFGKYGVNGMPTLVLFKNGEKIGTVNDDDPKVIIKALESHL